MPTGGSRVYYRERQRLTARDLEQGQTYLLDLDARHDTLLHAPGIVRGLRLDANVSGAPIVTPGLAIDGLGRELLLADAHPLDEVASGATEEAPVDVWLVYCREPLATKEPGRTACGHDAFGRWKESARAVITIPEPAIAEPGAEPRLTPIAPSDAAVYLGRIPSSAAHIARYTSLRAARVQDPADRARIDVGPVTLRDRNAFTLAVADSKGTPVTRLAIDRLGNNHLHGVVNVLDSHSVLLERHRRDEPDVEPNGLSFQPLTTPQQGTALPGVHLAAVRINERDIQELRIDLGEKKDGDINVRLSVGVPPIDLEQAWMTIDGNCQLTVGNTPSPPPARPPVNIDVTGTIEQAPIKADVIDPDFRVLYVKYWLAGLQSVLQATTVVKLEFVSLPTLIETDKAWSYDIKLTNTGNEDVTADLLLETRTISETTLLHTAATAVKVNANSSETIPISHQGNEMPEGELSIEMRISGKIGNFPWWNAITTAQPIPVVRTPLVELAGLPSSAPPGAEFSYDVRLQNGATRRLTLTAVTLVEGSASQQLLSAPRTLAPDASVSFGPIEHSNGISADLDIELTAAYQWENGPALQVTASQQVESAPDLEIEFDTPASIQRNAQWTYDLHVRNIGSTAVLLDSLRQRIDPASGPPTSPQQIPGTSGVAILPDQTATFMAVAGIVATAAGQIEVEVRAAYTRGSTTWVLPFAASPRITVT